MGQKVHPEALRVGYIHDWKSTWFNERDFSDYLFVFSSRSRHTRLQGDWSSDVCSSDLSSPSSSGGRSSASRGCCSPCPSTSPSGRSPTICCPSRATRGRRARARDELPERRGQPADRLRGGSNDSQIATCTMSPGCSVSNAANVAESKGRRSSKRLVRAARITIPSRAVPRFC